MSILKVILGEIFFRRTQFALSLFAATIAVTLFVAGPTLIEGYGRASMATLNEMQSQFETESKRYQDETRKIMLTMGFNLRILHEDTNLDEFWSKDFASVDMPEDYVERLANAETLTLVTHIVATLQQKVLWNDRWVLLVGYQKEATQPHRPKKKPMGYVIEPGTAYLGYRLGIGREVGDEIEVLGKKLRIAQILPEKGSKEDITIAVDLGDAQAMLDKDGKVNEILALGCRCEGERLPKVREQLAEVLPEAQILEHRSIALARAEQRRLVDEQNRKLLEEARKSREDVGLTLATLDRIVTPFAVLAACIWIGLLTLSNVRERRAEIGVWRALGVGATKIAALFLGKAVIVGLIAGGLGFGLGTVLGNVLGEQALGVEDAYFRPSVQLLAYSLAGAPILAALASYLPTVLALTQDPAVVLREE